MDKHKIFLAVSVPFVVLLNALPFTTRFTSSNTLNRYLWLFNNAIILYLLAATSLSFAAEEKWKNPSNVKLALEHKDRTKAGLLERCSSDEQNSALQRWIWTTRLIGSVAGSYILTIPIFFPGSDPILDCLQRVVTFFYGCKILDLAVARAHRPPIFLPGEYDPHLGLDRWYNRLVYVALLTSQTRYSAFDIAIHTPQFDARRAAIAKSRRWHYGPFIVFPLTLIFHFAELKILSGLVVIQFGLEIVHFVCHGNECPNPLFCQPFSAPTLTDFWTLHWHQGAQSNLSSLAYVPASRLLGHYLGLGKDLARAGGVLAAFGLSGIWHGWSAASLTQSEHAWTVAVGLWVVFVLQGVGCIAEKLIWGKQQGGWVQRIVVWSFAIETGAIWMRVAEARRVNIPWLEKMISR